MSARREIEAHLRTLGEIRDVMNAMKNLSLMEVRRLSRFLPAQRRAVATIEEAAADFLQDHPGLARSAPQAGAPYLVLGSERGLCGDFNGALWRALSAHLEDRGEAAPAVLVVGRRALAGRIGPARIVAELPGAAVTEEVPAVLEALVGALEALPAAAKGALLSLTVVRHEAAEREAVLRLDREARSAAVIDRPLLAEVRRARHPHPALLTLPPREFFAALMEQYLFAKLHALLYGSLLAEHQRRLQHLDGAIRRLERRTEELAVARNIVRQEEITQEIELIMLSADTRHL